MYVIYCIFDIIYYIYIHVCIIYPVYTYIYIYIFTCIYIYTYRLKNIYQLMVVYNLSSHGYPHVLSGPGRRLLYVLGILELMAFPLLGAGTFSMAPDEKILGAGGMWADDDTESWGSYDGKLWFIIVNHME